MPEVLTLEMVTLELPLLVSVTPRELPPPRFTLPKLKLLGVALNCEVTAAPVPERAMVAGELPASLVTETLPATFPAAVGAKVTFNVAV